MIANELQLAWKSSNNKVLKPKCFKVSTFYRAMEPRYNDPRYNDLSGWHPTTWHF